MLTPPPPLPPRNHETMLYASLYIFSGICQPLIMNVCKNAGLADTGAQLYMLFYYLGPSLLVFTLIHEHLWQRTPPPPQQQQQRTNGSSQQNDTILLIRHHPQTLAVASNDAMATTTTTTTIPTKRAVLKATGIAAFDICAQTLNYTGAALAGSTIFAVIYSSVTIWTALWSRLFLQRSLSWIQWLAILTVFGGLTVTALDSTQLGVDVTRGAFLIVLGSAMHGSTYVLSEAIMSTGDPTDRLTIRQNVAIQAVLASTVLGVWQLVYTVPRWESIITEPARKAGTTWIRAVGIMFGFALANLVHSLAFFHTLKHYPGGATSAGVMKGLQAVLVFVATHILFCGRTDRPEMCFTVHKLLSLVIVVSGVAIFGVATEHRKDSPEKRGYSRIASVVVSDRDISEDDDDDDEILESVFA